VESNDFVHPLFRDAPPPDAKLWRYLSFAKFAHLLHSPRLHFTRVDQFDDHFEGAWPKGDLEYWDKTKGFKVVYFTEQMKQRVAASCWVESPHESAAMWRLYAPGEDGVAVTTTFGKLRELVSPLAETAWLAGAGRVRYIDHFKKGLIEELGNGARLPNTMMPFMLKNVSYEHEKEVRALVVAGLGREIGREGFDLEVIINDFVDEIVVNPFCETWFSEAVAGLTDHYGLQSKLRQSSLSPDLFYYYEELAKKVKA
jgi:hypothetical protein